MATFEEIVDDALHELCENEEAADFILATTTGHERKVHKKILTLYSPAFGRIVNSKDSPEYKSGRLVLKDVRLTSMEGLLDYMYHRVQDWSQLESDARPRYFTELWNLAEKYNIKLLRSAMVSEFRDWTAPVSGESDDDPNWQYARIAVNAALRRKVPDELWLAMVKAWAAFSTEDEADQKEYDKILNAHPEFAKAVKDEAARGGLQNLRLPSS